MQCTHCGAQLAVTDERCGRCGTAPRAGDAAGYAPAALDAELVAAAIGPKSTEYYSSRFARFMGGGGLVSWHWPALFVSLAWLLYRKLWLAAALYLCALPLVFAVALAALVNAFGAGGTALAFALLLAFMFVVAPMFANALYYRAVTKRIAQAKRHGDRARQIEFLARVGGTANLAVVAILAVLVPVFGCGLLAAVSIPAYRDYGLRVQVTEGLAIAAPVKTAVAGAIAASGRAPADLAAAGLTADPRDLSGQYVDSVDVRDGRIDIRYGNGADAALAGRVLSITPYALDAAADKPRVAWRCGAAPAPAGAARELAEYRPGSLAVDLPRLVPSSCRS